MSVIWMNGGYPNYEDYDTSIHAFTPIGRERAADRGRRAEHQERARAARGDLRDRRLARPGRVDRELRVGLRRRHHDDTGPEPTHTYTSSGRYFPTLTVTDNDGASSTFVDEILVGLPTAPTVHTGGASGSTVHGAVSPQNQATDWSVEYGPTEECGAVDRRTVAPRRRQPPPGERDAAWARAGTALPLPASGRERDGQLVWRGPRVRGRQLAGVGHLPRRRSWRLRVWPTTGGSASSPEPRPSDETSATTGDLVGRYVLGQPGVLGPLGTRRRASTA